MDGHTLKNRLIVFGKVAYTQQNLIERFQKMKQLIKNLTT